jgi:hypothetical protein
VEQVVLLIQQEQIVQLVDRHAVVVLITTSTYAQIVVAVEQHIIITVKQGG